MQAAGMATKQQIKTEHDMDGECQSDRLVFPMAALTHCYKHSALKQHEFILFTVLELRSLDSVSTSSSQGVLKGCFLLGALRGSPISLTFFLSAAVHLHSLACDSFLHPRSKWPVCISVIILFFPLADFLPVSYFLVDFLTYLS